MSSSLCGSTSTPAAAVTNSGGPPTLVATTERPARHSFEERLAERLDQADAADDVRAGDPGGNLVVADGSRHLDPGPTLQLGAKRAVADERQGPRAEPLECVGEAKRVLALCQRSDCDERR